MRERLVLASLDCGERGGVVSLGLNTVSFIKLRVKDVTISWVPPLWAVKR